MDKHTNINKKKLIHLLITISFSVLVIGWFIVTVSNYNVSHTSDIATIFDQGFLTTQSQSMSGNLNDSFSSKDLIIVDMLENDAYLDLTVGDIVTYYDDSTRQLAIQRIVATYYDQGVFYLHTQADQEVNSSQMIAASDAVAVYKDKVVGLGSSFDYLQTPKGFIIFVMFPVFAILLYESMILAKNLVNYKKIRFENSFDRRYKDALRNLEVETIKIRQQIMANWITKKDS